MNKLILVIIFGIITVIGAVWVAVSVQNVFIANEEVQQANRDVEQSQAELDQAVKETIPVLKECINANGYDVCKNAAIDYCVSQGERSLDECTELFELVEKEL
jgi:type II secretory pathway pseudopilin PulG